MKIVFATANQNKTREIQALIPPTITLLSLNDIDCKEEISETQATIEGNASQKAFYVYEKYKINCFADDTGLEVEALNNRPGVFSARYAGEAKDANANMDKLLKELEGESNRKARFKTVISLVIDGDEKRFEGIVTGTISTSKKGGNGFGYDPLFIPNAPLSLFQGDGQEEKTFAEMDLAEKNKISHRALAVNKLVEYLNQLSLK